MNELKDLLCENECIARFSTTRSYYESYCIIDIDSDDITGALEDTLHRLLDAKIDVSVMGAFIPNDEEMEEMEEYEEYNYIDLGYCIDGLITYFEKN